MFSRRKEVLSGSFASGVLGDGLGSLRHSVLGELSGKKKSGGGLHLTRSHGVLLVVPAKTGCFGGNLLKHLVAEAVHDGHAL